MLCKNPLIRIPPPPRNSVTLPAMPMPTAILSPQISWLGPLQRSNSTQHPRMNTGASAVAVAFSIAPNTQTRGNARDLGVWAQDKCHRGSGHVVWADVPQKGARRSTSRAAWIPFSSFSYQDTRSQNHILSFGEFLSEIPLIWPTASVFKLIMSSYAPRCSKGLQG